MKTAVSVPDDLFSAVDRLARRSGRSRSEFYSAALREYMARHSPDDTTQAINRIVEQLGEDATEVDFSGAAARRLLESTEW